MVSDIVRTLLERRGITDASEVEKFLKPDFVRDIHDPFLLNDMEKGVARLFDAMENGQRIAIYADFDCDGIPGASVLSDFFQKIGYTNMEVYIPHRDREGYGFHIEAINALKARDVRVIITVDVGTVAHAGVNHAQSLGIDVIVTDHHEIYADKPNAFALINPKLDPYPFPNLCGAGVAWKLVCAMLIEGRERKLLEFLSIPEGWEKWLLDLVAIATVADMVPLVGENRALAHFGLTVLRKSPRLGLRELCANARIPQATVTEDDIGFTFAPRINAASRMDAPEIALKLLTTKDRTEAEECAKLLESLNRKRKTVVGVIVREAKLRAKKRFNENDRVVVLGDPDWKPALLGLAANSIMGDRGGVVVLWGRDANGNLKGSARSDGSISIVELFSKAGDALIDFGGHHASGGFSVSQDAVHTLPEVLKEVAESLQGEALEKKEESEVLVTLREVSWPLYTDLSRLAPFGIGNPKPVLRISRVSLGTLRIFGKEKNHVEVALSCFESGARARSFDFFRRAEDFSFLPTPGTAADVLGTLVRDSFRGPDALALRLVDIVESK